MMFCWQVGSVWLGRWAGLILTGAVIFGGASGAVAEDHWIEVRSPHFQVLTNGSFADGRKVALEFEQIRYLIHWRLPGAQQESRKPLMIFAVQDFTTAKKLLPRMFEENQSDVAGFFIPDWERNYALVRLDEFNRDGAREVVYHEYTHAILHQNAHWLPMWLDEGMAEFFGSSQVEEKRILLGVAPQRWSVFESSGVLPISKMLTMRDSDLDTDTKTDEFYAEAWGLVHYMTFGEGMQGGRLLSDFFTRLQKGEDEQKAFVAVFGDMAAFDQKFRKYAHRYTLSAVAVPPPPPIEAKDLSERVPTPAEVLLDEGIFEAGAGDTPGGQARVEKALLLDPNLAVAHEELGFLRYEHGEGSAARAEWKTAYQLDPTLYRALFAVTMTGTPLRQQTAEERKATLDSLRKVAHTGVGFAPAYVKIALLDWWQGDLEAAYRAANQAVELEPWRSGYRLLTAHILLAEGKAGPAAAIAHDVATWHPGGSDHFEAVELWDQIPAAELGDGSTLTFDLPVGAKMMQGTLKSLVCPQPGTHTGYLLKVAPDEASGPEVALTSAQPLHRGFANTLWMGGHGYGLCSESVGKRVVVGYKPGIKDEGVLLWLDVHDDLPDEMPKPMVSTAAASH